MERKRERHRGVPRSQQERVAKRERERIVEGESDNPSRMI